MAEPASRAFATEAKELAAAGQFGKAIEILQQGLKKFPKMVSARVLLGEVYHTSGDIALARVELEQVIKSSPDNFAAYRHLAQVYRDSGDKHAAAKACETVLQANPRDREMKDLLEEILAEPPGENPKEGDKAAPSKKAAAHDAPVSAERPDTLRLEKSPVGEATPLAPADEGISLTMEDQTEETDSETLAELYIVQGHREKGLDVYRRLAEKDPDNMKLHERIMALEEGEVPQEAPVQASRKARIRRLEGWLSVIRERRQS